MKKLGAIFLLSLCGLFLLAAVTSLPRMGDPENPTNSLVVPRYLEKGLRETGCRNTVTAILLSYRGYDTMMEMVVLFTALAAALAILGRESLETCCETFVLPSLLVRMVVVIFVPLFLAFALYVITHGFTTSGGGFQGGVIVATTVIIYTLVFGLDEMVKRISPGVRMVLESSAILSFMLVGLLGIALGGNFLITTTPTLGLSDFLRRAILLLLEVSIGLASGAVIISLFCLLKKVERG
ncbi:MAG: MnhB domain-containing protein [Actinomycetota bacterium]|nr:MnhB domain-containing protein [Actinomycetota bacterium]